MSDGPGGGAMLDPQAAIAKHAAITQAGGAGDAAIIARVESSIQHSPMGWLQGVLGETGARASAESGEVHGKIAEHQQLVSSNQANAPKDAGPAPAPGPAANPAVPQAHAAAPAAAPAPQAAAGGGAAAEKQVIAAHAPPQAGAAHAPAAAPAPTIAAATAGAGDSQIDGILNAYTPKSEQSTQTMGRIKQMGDVAQGFNGQLDTYVAQGGNIEHAVAASANFLGVGKDASAVWAQNPYRKVHGVLGGIMTGLSSVKSVCAIVGSVCGKLGMILTVIGLLGMIFPPIGAAVSGIARILNVVGVICDAISFVLSGILTGLNGVVLAQQIGAGASAEEKAATADLMLTEANDAASGFVNLAMMFGPKFMKGMLGSSKGVVASLLKRARATIGRISLKVSANVGHFANKIVRKLGFGGAGGMARVGGAWKSTSFISAAKEKFAASAVGKAFNGAPGHIQGVQDKLMAKYGNTGWAKNMDRVGAWGGSVAHRFDLEDKVGKLGESSGKAVGGLGAETGFGKRLSAAAERSEFQTRELGMKMGARDAAHLEESRWRREVDRRAASAPEGRIRSKEAEGDFIASRGDKVRREETEKFERAERGREQAERVERMKSERTDRRNDEYLDNKTNGLTGASRRDEMMGSVHGARQKRWDLEAQFKAQETERKTLLGTATKTTEEQARLTALNGELRSLDEARRINKLYEKDLSGLSAGHEREREQFSNWKDVGSNAWEAVEPMTEMMDFGNKGERPEDIDKKKWHQAGKYNKGTAKSTAAGRGGHGTFGDIAKDTRDGELASVTEFVRAGKKPTSVSGSVRGMLSGITSRGAQPAQPAAAPAPAPTTAQPRVAAPTPQVAAADNPAPSMAQAPGEPEETKQPDADAGEALPYWPALLPEFDQASHDFGWMRKVATEFKKAQIEGKQKAVNTLAVYGRYKEYAQARAAAAAKNQQGAQQAGHATQQNVANASQTEGQAGQGEAKQSQAKGAANDKAATDLPEPASTGFWGNILGAVKRWAKNKAAQVFGWIQEKIASVIMKGLCGVSMGDMREYAGALRHQQQLAHGVADGAGAKSGQVQSTSVKLGADANKEAQDAADGIGECDKNITDADTFMADVASFEQQLAEEKAYAQVFIANIHTQARAEQAKRTAESAKRDQAQQQQAAALPVAGAAAQPEPEAQPADEPATATANGPEQAPEQQQDESQIHAASAYVATEADAMASKIEARADDYTNQLAFALMNRTGKDDHGVDLKGPAKQESKHVVEAFKEEAKHTKLDMDAMRGMAIDPNHAHSLADTIIQSATHLEHSYDETENALDELFTRTYQAIKDGKRSLKSHIFEGDNALGHANQEGEELSKEAVSTALPQMNKAWDKVAKPIAVPASAPAAVAPAPAPAPTEHPGAALARAYDSTPAPVPAATAPAPAATVQRKANGEQQADAPATVANEGVASAGDRLPHHDQIQASFGKHDISHVRSKTGGDAAASSKALGASAYAIGDKVAFANSPDLHTAAHEAAHVVQQQAGVQLKGGIDAGKSDPYEQHADAVADAVVAGKSAEGLLDGAGSGGGSQAVQRKEDVDAQPGKMLVDAGPLVAGQMLKQAFLASLKPQVIAVANEELGRLGSALGCPYIEQYFAKYSALPAESALQLINRWIPGSRDVSSAAALVPLLMARVRAGVKYWTENHKLPPDLAAAEPGLAATATTAPAASGANVQRKSLDGLEQQLGAGEAVDQNAAAPMGAGDARIHRGAQADAMAAEHGAVAFAAGNNVVMSSNAPKQGTLAGDALLAHELAHTAQQRDAAKDPAERAKPIGAEEHAAETNADVVAEGAMAGNSNLARFNGFANRASDAMRTNVQLQRCSTEAAARDVRGAEYLTAHQAEIIQTASTQVEISPFATGDAAAKWAAGGNQKFAGMLASQLRKGVDLRQILLPEDPSTLMDTSRVMSQRPAADENNNPTTEKNPNYGPDRYFEATGITIANAIVRRTNESLKREVPRYIQAKNATVGEPIANGLMVSHPIDPLILTALAAGGVLDVEQVAFAKAHPDLTQAPSLVRPLPPNVLTQDPTRKDWWRLSQPTAVSREQIAITLGMPMTDAYRIEVAHPLYGVKDKTGASLVTGMTDAKDRGVVDEIALNQASSLGAPSTNPPAAVIAQIRMNAVMVRTSVASVAVALIGGNSDLLSFADRLSDRASSLEKGNDEAATKKWDVQSRAQLAIIQQAAKGLDIDHKRQLTYAAQFKNQIPEQQAQVLKEDAERWSAAIVTSDAVKTAEAMLQAAGQRSATLEMDIMEGQLADVQLAADLPHQDKDSNVNKDLHPEQLSSHEVELRKKLGTMRAQVLADPSQLDASSNQIATENQKLVFQAHVVMQAEQMDQTWRLLDETSGFWAWVVGDSSVINAYKSEGAGYYRQWAHVYALIKDGKVDEAQQQYTHLIRDTPVQQFLAKVQKQVQKTQGKQMIAKVIAMVVITVVSMGVGTVVEGLVGGAAVVAGAVEGGEVVGAVTTGLGVGRTGAAILGFAAETTTFTLASNLLLSKDHSATALLMEFGKNIAMFGAMRGLGKVLEVAGVGKIIEAGAATDATIGMKAAGVGAKLATDVAMGGAGVLAGYIEARIRAEVEGKNLTDEQVSEMIKMNVYQAIIMVIVGRVMQSPMQALKIEAAYQGSKWRMAYQMRAELHTVASGYQGNKALTETQIHQLINKDLAQIEAEKAAFEEVKATLAAKGKDTSGVDAHLAELDKFGNAGQSAKLMVGLKAQSPNHFMCPAEDMATLISQQQHVPGTTVEKTPGRPGEPETVVITNPAGEKTFVTEEAPAWTQTPEGQKQFAAAKNAGVEDAVMKMSDAERQAISRLERAIQSGDKQEIAKAKRDLGKLSKAQQDKLEDALTQSKQGKIADRTEKSDLARIREVDPTGKVRNASELTDADVALSMNAQMDKVKPGEIDAIVDKYPADQQERVRTVLAKSSGFGNMESLNELRAEMQPHLKRGSALYTPGRGSLADNVAYLGDKGTFDAKVPGSSGIPATTKVIAPKVIVILDAVVLAKIQTEPAFAKSLVDNKAILLEPVGFNDGNNMYNTPTPEVIAQRTKTILDRANAIQATDPKMKFDTAVTRALEEKTQKALEGTAVGGQLKGQLQIVDPASHANVKDSAAIAEQLNGKAGITADGVHNAVSGLNEADAALFRELMAHQAEIFSTRRQAQAADKQANNMYDIAASKGVPKGKVYYFIFKDMKSYGMVAMAHREMTGTAPDHYINGPTDLAAKVADGSIPPDGMLVILDDVAGSGDSLRQATEGAQRAGFRGNIVVSPMVSTVEARTLFNGAPGSGGGIAGPPGANVQFAPEAMVNSLKDSQWYSSLPKPKQDRLVDLLKHTGYPGHGGADLEGNGLCMAFPYMAPDNNNAFFADQVAPSFITNENDNASKNNYSPWTPTK